MAIRTYKVTLDSKNSIAPEPVYLRQGDKTGAVVIDATLMDNGSPVSISGLTPSFMANTADGKAVVSDTSGFAVVNASGGEFTYQVPSQLGSVSGKIKIAYFSFSDSFGAQSTFNVVFVVEKAVDMTQESAKDWVSNLNNIISQYNQWVNDAHSSWDEFVNENKEIIESIDPGGTLLAEVIDARNDGKNTFTTLRERLNQTVSINTDYFSNYEVIDYFKPEIDRVAAEIDKSKFNLLVDTDAHFSDNAGLEKGIIYSGAGKLSLNHFSNTIALSKGVDAVIAGGDQVEGNDILPASTAKDHSLIARKLMNNSFGADVFMILGNHDTDDENLTFSDTNANLTNQKLDVVVRESQIKEAYQTKSLRFSETRDGNSLYFYKDYPDKKVRLIGINTSDIGELTTAEGYAKYSRHGTCVIGQQQMNWIANVALMTTPTAYHVVMYGHIPLSADNWSGTLQEKGFTNQNANCDTLGYIIDAFKNGTSIHATNSTAADYPIDVTADFTQRGVGNFVAYFCGHVHHEEINDFHSFKNVLLLNSLAWTGYNSVPGQTREFGSVNEDAQTVISIDTALRHVNLIGFGSATDRTITY